MISDAKYQFTRNFEGYGQQGRDAQWPNGARIAISICLNYESVVQTAGNNPSDTNSMLLNREGGELTVLNGDAHSETENWEKCQNQSSTITKDDLPRS